MRHDERSKEQQLIDIMFQVAQHSAVYFCNETPDWKDYYRNTQEKHMEWVADQLRQCGFDTVPMGSSWGVLK